MKRWERISTSIMSSMSRARHPRLTRPEKQRDVFAPGDIRRLEKTELLPAEAHEFSELLGLEVAKVDPAIHVDAAEAQGGVHAVVDVALVDVVFELGARAREHVAVPGGIDHHPGAQCASTCFAFEQHPADAPVLDHGRAAQACSTMRTPVSSSISCVAILSRSGSIVGAQQTTPWKAEVLEPQYLASAGSREPQSAGAGPAYPSAGKRSMISSVKPRMTWRPVQSVMRSIQMTRPPVERPPR